MDQEHLRDIELGLAYASEYEFDSADLAYETPIVETSEAEEILPSWRDDHSYAGFDLRDHNNDIPDGHYLQWTSRCTSVLEPKYKTNMLGN